MKIAQIFAPNAKAEADRAHAREIELDAMLTEEESHLSELVRASAEALATGGSAPDGASFARLKSASQVDTLRAAIAKLRADRPGLIAAAHAEKAATLRAQAAEKREEAKALTAKVQELLDKLHELQSVTYVPKSFDNFTYDELIQRGGAIPVPRTEQLLSDAEHLEAEARELQGKTARDAGTIEAATVEEILTHGAFADPFVLAPARHAVREWVSAALAEAMIDPVPTLNGKPLMTVIKICLVWRCGEIDTDGSAVVREVVHDQHGYSVYAHGPEAAA